MAEQEKTVPQKSPRENLIDLLSSIKKVKINSAKRLIFAIHENVSYGEVIFFLHCKQKPQTEFGKNGEKKLVELPDHALLALYRGIQSGDLFDVTKGEVEIPKPPEPPTYETYDEVPHINDLDNKNSLLEVLYGTENIPRDPEEILKKASKMKVDAIRDLIDLELQNSSRVISVVEPLEELLSEKKKGK